MIELGPISYMINIARGVFAVGPWAKRHPVWSVAIVISGLLVLGWWRNWLPLVAPTVGTVMLWKVPLWLSLVGMLLTLVVSFGFRRGWQKAWHSDRSVWQRLDDNERKALVAIAERGYRLHPGDAEELRRYFGTMSWNSILVKLQQEGLVGGNEYLGYRITGRGRSLLAFAHRRGWLPKQE